MDASKYGLRMENPTMKFLDNKYIVLIEVFQDSVFVQVIGGTKG
jgi:hypothetical protein